MPRGIESPFLFLIDPSELKKGELACLTLRPHYVHTTSFVAADYIRKYVICVDHGAPIG